MNDHFCRHRISSLRSSTPLVVQRLSDTVSRQTVNAIETGKDDPSLPLAFQIARCFTMPVESVFFSDEVPDPETS
jgi:putative transcriptional regulator